MDTWHSCLGGKAVFRKTVNVHKFVSGILTSHRLRAPCRFGRDGGGPPDADDLAGSERGWGVPVQPVREAGELGGEWSNRAEVESQLNKDYERRDNLVKWIPLAITQSNSCRYLSRVKDFSRTGSWRASKGLCQANPSCSLPLFANVSKLLASW